MSAISIDKKRLDAAMAITSYTVGTATAAAIPTLGGEIPKQLIFTASDILMYTKIWKIYFEEDLSTKNLLEMLRDLGLVTVSATGAAYVATKATTAVLTEIGNWMGPLGWAGTAAIAGSISALFGATWALYCDYLFSQKQSQTVS